MPRGVSHAALVSFDQAYFSTEDKTYHSRCFRLVKTPSRAEKKRFYIEKTMFMKQSTSANLLTVAIMLFIIFGCSKTSVKFFTDPSLSSTAIKSIAVFPMRNTAFSPGETMDMNRSMTQGVQRKNPSLKIVGPSEANTKINDAGLADQYAKFLVDFEYSGVPNTTILT